MRRLPLAAAISSPKKYMNDLLTRIVTENGHDPVPSYVAKKIIRHCRDTTGASREWMEQNPNGSFDPNTHNLHLSLVSEKLAHNYKKYPGKLDHTTIIVAVVGPYVRRLTQSTHRLLKVFFS